MIFNYSYTLPSELIATHPITPRQNSKLLVYNRATREIIHSRFYSICSFLPKNLGVIFNNSKVLKARIYGKKSSGGRVELLYERSIDRETSLFMIKGRVRVGERLLFDEGFSGEVVALHKGGFRVLKIFKGDILLDSSGVLDFLDRIGHIPLPPYIKREDREEDRERYQSVFASNSGSVAAPTASLHFSKELFESFLSRFECGFVTLHIGSGTFKPIEGDDIYAHKMHPENYSITQEAINIIESDKPLLCVGSTALRSVEEYVRSRKRAGETSIYITPKNPPKRCDYLLTNFHLPKTSLLVMVASIIGESELKRVYNEAISKRYRFYSYGDAMLII